MQLAALLFAAIWVADQPGAFSPDMVEVKNCLVALVEEAQVSGQEAGVLKEMKVQEGQLVVPDQLMAQIDDTKAKIEHELAAAKLAVAMEKANDDINVRYAIAAHDVAKAEFEVNAEANRKVPGSVPPVRMNELALKVEETRLAIDKSKLDQRVAKHEAEAAQAEVDGAVENIRRRQIKSTVDGMVVERHRHPGEWVQAGEQVLHVIRMDRLWVEGFVSASQYNRHELEGREVSVDIELARGQHVCFAGKVIYAKPTTEAGGTFLVRAEIQNRKENGNWIISPGLNAMMKIQLR